MATKHTPGPWRWELNMDSKRIQLSGGKPQYDLTVMDFVRYGMQGAQPRFRTDEENFNILEPCYAWAEIVPGRSHHANWFQTLNHPDAKLIAAAPDLLEALQEIVDLIEPYSLGWESHGAQEALKTARNAIQKATL